MPKVSVVISTFHRSQHLKNCLAALSQQWLPPTDYELIISDDGGDFEARHVVEQYRNLYGLNATYIHLPGPQHGSAAARNIGWRNARSPIVAFTDDDCVPHPHWLAEGLTAFREGTAAIWGKIKNGKHQLHLEKAEFATANCFYRYETLKLVGGFDSDLFLCPIMEGSRLDYAPKAVVSLASLPSEAAA